MTNKMGRKPSFAMIPVSWADSPNLLPLMNVDNPCPVAILTLSSCLAVKSEYGGQIMDDGHPLTIASLAWKWRVDENKLRTVYEKLEHMGFVEIENDTIIINFGDYQKLSKSARDKRFKNVENQIDQRFSGDNPNPTYTDRISRLPFMDVNEILKQGNYSNLSVYINTKGDYLTDQIVKKFEELESKNYSYKFLRAVIVEADTTLTNNESAYKNLWEKLNQESEPDISKKQLETPPETPQEPPETPGREKSGTRRQLSFEESKTRHRIKNRNFSMVYSWFQSNLEAFDVIFKGENINNVKNAFVDYANDGHNGTFEEFLNKYGFELCDDHESQLTLQMLDDSIDHIMAPKENHDSNNTDSDDDDGFAEYPF